MKRRLLGCGSDCVILFPSAFAAEIPLLDRVRELHATGIANTGVFPRWDGIRLRKTDAPFQEQPQARPRRVQIGFHDDELTFRQRFQLVRAHERPLGHLHTLTGFLPSADRARENGAVAESFGQHLRSLAVRRKAAEDRVLAVILNDLAAFFAVILFKLRQALDDRHQRQTAGAAGGEERENVKGGHRTQLVAEQHDAVFELRGAIGADCFDGSGSSLAVSDKRKIVSSSKKHLDRTFFLFMKHRFLSSLRKSCIFAKKQCEI